MFATMQFARSQGGSVFTQERLMYPFLNVAYQADALQQIDLLLGVKSSFSNDYSSLETYSFVSGMRVGLKGQHGLGLLAESDKQDFFNTVRLRGAYNLRKNISDYQVIFGMGLTVLQVSATGEWNLIDNPQLGLFGDNDPLIPQLAEGTGFDLSMGLTVAKRKWKLGLGASNLISPEIGEKNKELIQYKRAIFLSVSNKNIIDFSQWKLDLEGSLLYQGFLFAQISAIVIFNHNFVAGFGFSSVGKVNMSAGLQLGNGVTAYYLVDFKGLSYSFTTQELVLGYSINVQNNKRKQYKTIRYQ